MSHGNWMTYRSYTADQSVKKRTIAPGTTRRILTYARPYRTIVSLFLVTLVIDSVLVVAQPLLFRRIVDQGITPGNPTVVTVTAGLVALVAIVDAGLPAPKSAATDAGKPAAKSPAADAGKPAARK